MNFRKTGGAGPSHATDCRALEERRRELAEKERALAEMRERLREEIGADALPPEPEPVPLPVWRQETEEHFTRPVVEPTPARKRALARERQQQRVIFFIGIVVLILAALLVLWLFHTHPRAA